MDTCQQFGIWAEDEPLLNLLHAPDVIISMLYFAIPFVIIYFTRMSPVVPHKSAFIFFGIVAILCGANYLSNLWMFSPYFMIVKGCLSAVLWLAIIVMKVILPKLFTLEKGEPLLRKDVEELRIKKSLMLRQEGTTMPILKLTHEIRSSLDGERIIQSAIVGLGQILNLEECALWFPSQTNRTLWLSHSLKRSVHVGSAVPMSLPVVAEIFGNSEPVKIPYTCPLVKATSICRRCTVPDVFAIRVPILHYSCTEPNDAATYAVMVVELPSVSKRKFCGNELELFGFVAKQVAVALAHASAVEESTMNCKRLMKMHHFLELAVENSKMAFSNTALHQDGIFRQMLTFVDAIPVFTSFLLETTLTPQQRTMVEAVIRNSNFLQSMMVNMRDLSELENGTLQLNYTTFDPSSVIKLVVDKIKPVASVAKLSVLLSLAPNLPAYAAGDKDRLMQVILNILSNAVKFTQEGHISVTASVAQCKSFRGWRPHQFHMASSKKHFYLRIQVQDSGCGIDPKDIPRVFNKFSGRRHTPLSSRGGLGLPICKRLLDIMGGHIWVESEGLGKGTTVTVVIQLGIGGKDT